MCSFLPQAETMALWLRNPDGILAKGWLLHMFRLEWRGGCHLPPTSWPWPCVVCEHLTFVHTKLRCAVSVKCTLDFRGF